MKTDTVAQAVNESNFIKLRVIKDLETGNEYPYADVDSAVNILKRIARSDGCSVSQALETLWVMGSTQDELKAILSSCRGYKRARSGCSQ